VLLNANPARLTASEKLCIVRGTPREVYNKFIHLAGGASPIGVSLPLPGAVAFPPGSVFRPNFSLGNNLKNEDKSEYSN
jgi:hypothetical protein